MEDKCPFCGAIGREIVTTSGNEKIEYKCGVREPTRRRSPKCYETELTRKDELLMAVGEGLKEIAIGRGAFNRDPLIHAGNTIDSMKDIARMLLTKMEKTP